MCVCVCAGIRRLRKRASLVRHTSGRKAKPVGLSPTELELLGSRPHYFAPEVITTFTLAWHGLVFCQCVKEANPKKSLVFTPLREGRFIQ